MSDIYREKIYHIGCMRPDCILYYILLAEDTDCIHPADRHIEGRHSRDFVDCCSNFGNRIDHILLHIVESSDLVGMIVLLVGRNLRPVEMWLLVNCCSGSFVGSVEKGCHPAQQDHLPKS